MFYENIYKLQQNSMNDIIVFNVSQRYNLLVFQI